MCNESDYTSTVWREQWIRARKPHGCHACSEEIRAGDRYLRTSFLSYGSWTTLAHCARCCLMIDALTPRVEYVDLGLDCGDTWPDAPPEIAALAFMTREEAQAVAKQPRPGGRMTS